MGKAAADVDAADKEDPITPQAAAAATAAKEANKGPVSSSGWVYVGNGGKDEAAPAAAIQTEEANKGPVSASGWVYVGTNGVKDEAAPEAAGGAPMVAKEQKEGSSP